MAKYVFSNMFWKYSKYIYMKSLKIFYVYIMIINTRQTKGPIASYSQPHLYLKLLICVNTNCRLGRNFSFNKVSIYLHLRNYTNWLQFLNTWKLHVLS